jgi:hypothetical protein
MTEHDRAEPVNRQRHRIRQPGEPVHVASAELTRCPRRDRIWYLTGLAARQLDEFPVGVAAYPYDPVAEPEQPVKHLGWLWPRGDIPGEHDALGVPDGGLGQYRIECRQHSVYVRKHGDGSDHSRSLPARCRTGQRFSLPA